MRKAAFLLTAPALLLATALPFASPTPAAGPAGPLDRIDHLVVIFMENWSFDGLYGRFPGADGMDNAPPSTLQQVDLAGRPYPVLPPPVDEQHRPDPRVPASLPVRPFDLAPYV